MTEAPPAFLPAFAHSLASILGVACLSLGIALVLGTLAGRRPGIVNELLRRSIELCGALPLFVLLPLLSRVWSPLWSSIVVLGSYHGLCLASMCRNETAAAHAESFVRQARSLGVAARHVHQRHVLPWILPSLATGMVMVLPLVVGAEAVLSSVDLGFTESLGGYMQAHLGAPGLLTLALFFVLGASSQALVARLIRGFLGGNR